MRLITMKISTSIPKSFCHFPQLNRMLVRPNASSKALKNVSIRGLKTRPRTSIPLPERLEKLKSSDHRTTGRTIIPAVEDRENRRVPLDRLHKNDVVHETFDRTKELEKTIKMEGAVEAFIEKHAPTTYSYSVNPLMNGADLLFDTLPAHISRIALDPSTIFKLLPTIDKLLPKDPHPLNADIKATNGVRDLGSWTMSGEKGKGLTAYNGTHLGWTLAMYPTIVDPSSLLFDGTDQRFLPGPPEIWRYRVWSGGIIRHYVEIPPRLTPTSSHIHHVLEKATNITVAHDTAKVTVLKSLMPYMGKRLGGLYTGPNMLRLIGEEPTEDLKDYNGPYAVEEYRLTFFKKPPKTLSEEYVKFIPAPKHQPQFSHTLIFHRHHLFCWSAVTQNAHLIHLDSDFAKKEYGAKDLIVQGPFTVFLILEWLRRTITEKAVYRLDKFMFTHIDYKIFAPIFVGEPVRFCARPTERAVPGSVSKHWQIWAEKRLPRSPNDSVLTFMAKVSVATEAWSGRSIFSHEGDDEQSPKQPAAEEVPAEDAVPDPENNPSADDFASQGFSSPFFSR